MVQYLQVEDRKHLVRDSSTGAIINNDTNSLTKAQQLLRKAHEEKNRLLRLEEKVNSQEKTLEEIKQLLLKALEK
jgi:predicted transcriptional regulator